MTLQYSNYTNPREPVNPAPLPSAEVNLTLSYLTTRSSSLVLYKITYDRPTYSEWVLPSGYRSNRGFDRCSNGWDHLGPEDYLSELAGLDPAWHRLLMARKAAHRHAEALGWEDPLNYQLCVWLEQLAGEIRSLREEQGSLAAACLAHRYAWASELEAAVALSGWRAEE